MAKRKSPPKFSAEHRRRLAEAAKGNRNAAGKRPPRSATWRAALKAAWARRIAAGYAHPLKGKAARRNAEAAEAIRACMEERLRDQD